MSVCPFRKGKFGCRETHKENIVKIEVNAATSQGMVKIVSKPSEPRRQFWNKSILPHSLRRTSAANTLSSKI